MASAKPEPQRVAVMWRMSGKTETTWTEEFFTKQVSGSHSKAYRQSGKARHAERRAEDTAAGDMLRQAGAKVREQTILAEAKFSCRGDTVRTHSPTEQGHPKDERQPGYLSTACWMRLIQLFRSSLELVWISYISGPADDALIRNMPRSSLATSLAISF